MLELDEQVVELVETRGPGALEGAHPIRDGFQRRAVDPLPSASSLRAHADEADRPQNAEVLGHLRLTQT